MHYFEKREARLGDHVDLGDGSPRRVVGLIEQAAYDAGLVQSNWSHLRAGVLVMSQDDELTHVSDLAEIRLLWREEKQPPLVEVSIYISGDDLQPAVISQRLGVAPDHSQTRGDVRISQGGKSFTRKIGLWAISLVERTVQIEILVEAVVSRLAGFHGNVRDLPEVQHAYLDLFIAEEEGNTRTVEVSPMILARLNELGLALYLTIGG